MGQTEMRMDESDTNASTTSTSGMVAPYQTARGAVIIPPSKPGLTVIEPVSTTGTVSLIVQHAQALGIFGKGRSNHFLHTCPTRAPSKTQTHGPGSQSHPPVASPQGSPTQPPCARRRPSTSPQSPPSSELAFSSLPKGTEPPYRTTSLHKTR